MIKKQDLRELVSYTGDKVVSLYLNTDLSRESKEKCKLVLREHLGKIDGEALSQDLDRIERFFSFEYDWQGRGVVIFSCQAQRFWRAYSLPVPVPDGAFVADRPHVKPLVYLADKFGSYGVVIVDREDVRMFHIQGGRVLGESETIGEEIKRHKQGGWSQARYQRWVDGQAAQNLKQAAEEAEQFLRNEGCQRVILGGTEVNLAQFQDMLPKQLQERIAGTFPVGRMMGIDDILERSWEIMQRVEREEGEKLVEEMITAARKGGLGATGLADTLYRLREGRVRIMLVAEGLSAPGHVCSSCGYVSVEGAPKCLFCGGEDMRPIEDAVEHAVYTAVKTGVKVETVEESQPLEEAGGIGAILRY